MAKVQYATAHFTDAGGHSNEDSFLLRYYKPKSIFLIIVSDGVGGLEAGELASGFIKKSFDKWFDRNVSRFDDMPIDDIKNNAYNEIIKIHENLLDISEDRGNNFGATLTMLLAKRWDYFTAQVGDSRLYMQENGKTRQITTDQTVAEYERVTGKKISSISEDRKEHVLMQCMGQRKIIPDFSTGVLPMEYAFLACSDGLSNTISLEEFDAALNDRSITGSSMLRNLAEMARGRGERDNITSVFVRREKI